MDLCAFVPQGNMKLILSILNAFRPEVTDEAILTRNLSSQTTYPCGT